jgi:hypothetical protein
MKVNARKSAWWAVAVAGVVLTAVGLFGLWLQGAVYEKGFPTPATIGEIWVAFTLPTAVTTAGSLILAAVLLASPLTAAWTPTSRFGAFISFTVLVLVACAVCGHLAASRVANILN